MVSPWYCVAIDLKIIFRNQIRGSETFIIQKNESVGLKTVMFQGLRFSGHVGVRNTSEVHHPMRQSTAED
jgi:hypothetical protein